MDEPAASTQGFRRRILLARLVQLGLQAQFFAAYSPEDAAAISPLCNALVPPTKSTNNNSDRNATNSDRNAKKPTNILSVVSSVTAAFSPLRSSPLAPQTSFFGRLGQPSPLESSTDHDSFDSLDDIDSDLVDSIDLNDSFDFVVFSAQQQQLAESAAIRTNSLPPIVRALYDRIVRSLPIFENSTFISRFDSLFENVFLAAGKKLLTATRIDALHLMSHYIALFVDIKNDEWLRVRRGLPPRTDVPLVATNSHAEFIALDRRYADQLLIAQNAYTRQLSHMSFSAARPLVSNPQLDLYRMNRAMRFIYAMRSFFRTGSHVMLHLKRIEIESKSKQTRSSTSSKSSSRQVRPVPMYWRHFAESPKYNSLPQEYLDFMNNFPCVIAHIFDNILDEPGRLQKFTTIVSRLPVSFVVISLRFINPGPLVERVLRLFLWQPTKGMHSLLQKLGAYLCDHNRTTSRHKHYRDQIPPHRKTIIDNATKDSSLSSLRDADRMHDILVDAGLHDPTCTETKYAYLCIRKREKDEFIDFLATPTIINLIIHIAQLIPMFLKDMSKYGDLSFIVGNFFEALRKTISALERYGEYRRRVGRRSSMSVRSDHDGDAGYTRRRPSVISNASTQSNGTTSAALGDANYDEQLEALNLEILASIEIAWRAFCKSLYGVLHNLGKAALSGGVKDSIILRLVDWIMYNVISRIADPPADAHSVSDADPVDVDDGDRTHVGARSSRSDGVSSNVGSTSGYSTTTASATHEPPLPVPPSVDPSGYATLDHVLSNLTSTETKTLWDEVDRLADLALSGLDQRLWPYMPTINGRVTQLYLHEIMQQVSAIDTRMHA